MIKSKGIKKSAKLTLNNSQRLVFGSFLVLLGVVLFFSIVSYFLQVRATKAPLLILATEQCQQKTGSVN
jgi:hypothetical protein